MVYRLAGVDQGADVWKPVPENYYFADGTFDFGYNFDFTRYDVNFFIEGNDLGTLSPNFTQDQIFRVVIVPGYFGNKTNVQVRDYQSLVRSLGIESKPVVKLLGQQ